MSGLIEDKWILMPATAFGLFSSIVLLKVYEDDAVLHG